MAFKERIIDEAKRELGHVVESIAQTPSLIDPLQQVLDDYKIPASRYDKEVAELTILVNEKVSYIFCTNHFTLIKFVLRYFLLLF